MSKQRIVNNGPNIRNGNMIGGEGGIKPVNGSWTQGVEASRMSEVRAKMAAAQQQQKPVAAQTAPTQQATMKGPKP